MSRALRTIAEAVAADRGVTLKGISERTRIPGIAWVRQDAMRAQREGTGASYPRIAAFWGMDHSTVIYGVRRSAARAEGASA